VISGRDTLRSIDDALTQARSQVAELTGQLETARAELLACEQKQTGLYRALARVRVSEIAQRPMLDTLDEAERRVRELTERREQEIVALNKQLREQELARGELEKRRTTLDDTLSQASERVDALEAEIQEALQGDSKYQAQLQRCQQAETIARRAERKTETADMNRKEKGKPYEDDPLFMYLWERGYGTSGYKGSSGLIRRLDRWVAGLCGYQGARSNYAMLLELPQRLREHTVGVQTQAEQQAAELRELEEHAAALVGLDNARAAMTEADRNLAELDSEIEQADTRIAELEASSAQFSGGQDTTSREAADYLSAVLREENLSTLMREARQTPTPDDDRIVEQIADLREQRHELEDKLEQERRVLRRFNARIGDLEKVRREFRNRRYDSSTSGFSDGALVGMLLSQFLGGVLNSRDLWRSIEREQRWYKRRSNPDFGSGGLGRGGGIWTGGFPGCRDGSVGGGTGGGFGGGGFGTGGGFGGGGGFKTGGGF
jgi:chromosome segregation ATPase